MLLILRQIGNGKEISYSPVAITVNVNVAFTVVAFTVVVFAAIGANAGAMLVLVYAVISPIIAAAAS